MRPRLGSRTTSCGLCLFLAFCYIRAAHSESLFKLSDLSNDRRAELFTQIDAWGLVTAFLNYCQRPPNIVEKLTPIVQGCVDEASFAAVKDKYNAAVVSNSGGYDCAGPGTNKKIPEIEGKIASAISRMRTACRLRSFYHLSIPKFNFP